MKVSDVRAGFSREAFKSQRPSIEPRHVHEPSRATPSPASLCESPVMHDVSRGQEMTLVGTGGREQRRAGHSLLKALVRLATGERKSLF